MGSGFLELGGGVTGVAVELDFSSPREFQRGGHFSLGVFLPHSVACTPERVPPISRVDIGVESVMCPLV